MEGDRLTCSMTTPPCEWTIGFGQAGGAGRIDHHSGWSKEHVFGASQRRVAGGGVGPRRGVGESGGAGGRVKRGSRTRCSTLGSSASSSPTSARRSVRLAAASGSRRRSSPSVRSGGNGRARRRDPSGEHTDQMAPRLATARKAITDSGMLGMKATTRSPRPRPARAGWQPERRPDAAVRPTRRPLSTVRGR